MGRADFYKFGDYNAECDLCGFKYKSSDLRMNGDSLFICPGCWQVGKKDHPQNKVKGIPDDQTVPISRPWATSGSKTTTVSSAGSKYDTTITLTSVTGIVDRTAIGIVLDNGAAHWTYSDDAPVGSVVTLGSYLPYPASAGNTVYIEVATNETYITATGISATEL